MPIEKYADIQLVTPEAVAGTVLADGQTRLWFRRLLRERGVVEKLVTFSPSMVDVLRHYRMLTVLAIIFLGLSAAVLVLASNGTFSDPRELVGTGVILALLAVWCFLRKRRMVAHLASRLIEVELPSLPAGATLYQVGEILAERYRVPSLVDTIWIWDQTLRNAFLVIVLLQFEIYFVSVFWTYLSIILYCWGVCLMVQGSVLFSRPGSGPRPRK